LRQDPGRDEVRRRLVDVYLSLPRGFTEAGRHLELLLAGAPDDADLLYKSGLCLDATARYAEAKQAYERALLPAPKLTAAAAALAAIAALRSGCETVPDDPDFPTTLAELLLKEGQEEKVLPILKHLEARPGAADRAQYLRALLAMSHGRWAEAAGLLERLRAAA